MRSSLVLFKLSLPFNRPYGLDALDREVDDEVADAEAGGRGAGGDDGLAVERVGLVEDEEDEAARKKLVSQESQSLGVRKTHWWGWP